MAKDWILAIDNGTQSVRALLFDPAGNLISKVRIPIEPYYASAPGLAEQDPLVFWNGLCRACQQLWQINPQARERIAGVTLTTQRGTVINLGRDGQPLRPAMVWLDQRRTEGLKPVGGFWGLAFLLSGMSETVAYLQAEAEVNWIRTHQPEIWSQTHKYLFLSGYLTHKLVGKYVNSKSCQVGYVPFDYKKQDWAGKSDWKWQAVPMDEALLPDLLPATSVLGEITSEASQATGIPQGLPLIAAAADKACEVIGAGCMEPHVGCLSYGTTATINITHKKYIEPIPLIPPYPSAIPDAYTLEIQIYRGFWMVSWFKQEFGIHEQELARSMGVETEELLDRLLEQAPPGSDGLVLQPYWSPGLKVPWPGSSRGRGRFWRRAHPRASLPRHPGRSGLCPPGGPRSHRSAHRYSHQRAARCRRRQPEPPDHADYRRHLWHSGFAPAFIRGFRPGRRHRRGRGVGLPPRLCQRCARNDSPGRHFRTGRQNPRPLPGPVRAGIHQNVQALEAALP